MKHGTKCKLRVAIVDQHMKNRDRQDIKNFRTHIKFIYALVHFIFDIYIYCNLDSNITGN